MLKEIVLSLAVLSPTGIPAETPEIYFTPTPAEETTLDFYRTDGEYTYIDYLVTDVEKTYVPQTGASYYTIWATDPFGDEDCLADDVEELEDWMVTGTTVKHGWKTTEEWYTGDVVEIIG